MANNDVWVRLEDIADITSGGTPSKAREDYWIGDIPWVSAKDLKTPRLFDAEDHISEEGLKNGTRLAPAGATLILTRGMTLISDVPTCIAERDLAFNQDLKALVAKKGVDSRYLNYAVLAAKPTLLAAVELAGHGTGRLPTDRLKSLQIWLPPENDQRRIAHVLGTLDDKIELNRQLNATLEALARALFQSWFVAFDPVRAKLSGEPEAETCRRLGLTPEVLALFPDELEESALGEIPKGWAVKSFAETVELIGGGTPKTSIAEYWDGDIPWFSVVDAPSESDVFVIETEKSISESGLKNSSTRLLPELTTIISARGTVGRLALTACPMTMNQSCYAIRGKNSGPFFTYFATRELVAILKQSSHGTVFDTITRDTFSNVHLPIPDDLAVASAFDEIVEPVMLNIKQNLEESRILAALRDELLPKLLSGEVRLA